MRALGINWNRLDPFPRYGPFDFPVIQPVAAPYTPLYNYPVITEPQVVAPTAPAAGVPDWVVVGGAALAGIALTALLLKKA